MIWFCICAGSRIRRKLQYVLAPEQSFLLHSLGVKDKQGQLGDVYTAPFFIFDHTEYGKIVYMLQRMFYHCYFLQNRPQASSAGGDKLLLVSLIGVSQKRGQILLLCGTINPVISSARSKQITMASGHLHLIIPDDIMLDHGHSLVQ